MRKRLQKEAGIAFVMMALMAAVILSFAALALGIGFLTTERSRMNAIGNVSALSALEYYVRDPDDLATSDETKRRKDAVKRANFILEQNKLVGTTDAKLGEMYLNGTTAPAASAGIMRFGKYYRKKPDDSPYPCGNAVTDYPCFKELDQNDTGLASAVNIEITTPDSNKSRIPILTGLIGDKEYKLKSSATATLVNSCVGHLLDVSASTVSGTHNQFRTQCVTALSGCNSLWGNAARKITEPVVQGADPSDSSTMLDFSMASQFAYNAEKVFDDAAAMLGGNSYVRGSVLKNAATKDCTDALVLNQNYPDLFYWCNMYPERKTWEAVNGAAPAGMFFRSDYDLQKVFKGQRHEYMMVSKGAQHPSPLDAFMLGANISLRLIEGLPSQSNRGFFWAFTGVVGDRAYPPLPGGSNPDPNLALTRDLGFLTQLTNLPIIGRLDDEGNEITTGVPVQQHANLLDAGFFPMDPVNVVVPVAASEAEKERAFSFASANIPLAVLNAGQWLSAACERSARKSIFLYTDGLSTCKLDADFSVEPPTLNDNSCIVTGAVPWDNYLSSESAVFGGLIDYLRKRGVTVTVFFTGKGVNPNFRNVKDPASTCDPDKADECFLSLPDAYQQHGYRGVHSGSSGSNVLCSAGGSHKWLFNCASTDAAGSAITASDAFKRIVQGEQGVTFGRANGVLGELALGTGGLYCPLMDTLPAANYVDHDGDFSAGNGCSLTESACCQKIFNNDLDARGKTPCMLKNSVRLGEAWQTKSISYAPKSMQAALCAQQSVDSNPYMLAEPVNICLRGNSCQAVP